MRVVKFKADERMLFYVGEEPYFLLRIGRGRHLLCPSRCPHRGGPLHLGRRAGTNGALTCPWHDASFSPSTLARRAVPAVRRGDEIAAVFPLGDEAPVRVRHCRVLANESQ
ncbi:Rieske (2Fe-2S) protein [Sorangium sp. So ce117]|uniref:Rieske (2Fe-2S) protein n=1 Tax=Sorangium sp. So ce117 TaxID=3133277 RepID=UPI003F61F73E